MATKISSEDLLENFESMTVLELSEFLKAFEEKFDVTAAAPVAAVAVAGDGDAGGAEEQTEFDVMLITVGDKKIQVIKEVRSLTSLGLKEATAVADDAPSAVLEGVDADAAQKAKEALEAVGAMIELK